MTKTIYLAGGCFWGVEEYYSAVPGVIATEVGYANGNTDTPTYEQVCTGTTGHTEAVRVDYDPDVAPLTFLLKHFFEIIDPTSVNRQGNDIGTQYRTGIYWVDPGDREVVEQALAEEQQRHRKPLAVESEPLRNFSRAEEYHQRYLKKHPSGYCHIPRSAMARAACARPTD